ncbi:Abi family protein [Streptomyces sp. NRRL F-5650]|uniref:Abi family protein n=1 Tax=Streptomyces sp. NRRL F-5650 TaxID=1463868 RepID=UPI0006924AC9|nr:Abi family protein [Streptomyces sp. NRRL F-5650]
MTHASPAPAPGPWVENWLSPARHSIYLSAAGGDLVRALALYEWNTALTCAVLRDLSHFEIALRNAYAGALDATWTGATHWLDDPASPLRAPLIRVKKGGRRGPRQVDINDKTRSAIDSARKRYGRTAPPGKVIADLSLGVWRYLSTSAHEKTLWVPHLHFAFPPGTNRATVDQLIGDLHELRNRAAHWEPLLTVPVDVRMKDLLTVTGLLGPDLAAYIQHSSHVTPMLAQRP